MGKHVEHILEDNVNLKYIVKMFFAEYVSYHDAKTVCSQLHVLLEINICNLITEQIFQIGC